jgi:hypothetical protein
MYSHHTGAKVVIAYFIADRPEMPVSVGVSVPGCVHF